MKQTKQMIMKKKEGWTWLWNSKKWHYFRNGQSLCRKFMLLSKGDFEQGNNDSSDNCKGCKRELEKQSK